jgi:hypothetical protein
MRDFNTWLGKMRPSINNYGYYVDFQKVYDNVDSINVDCTRKGIEILQRLVNEVEYLKGAHIQ